MLLKAGYASIMTAAVPSPVILVLRPQSGDGQQIKESAIVIEPRVPTHEYTDAFGNACLRATLNKGDVVITSTCRADVPDEIDVDPSAGFTPIDQVPDAVLQYLLPSRYCPSDLFEKEAFKITRKASPGYGQAEAIRQYIQRRFKYRYGVSNASTSALETWKKRAGVCRDFSHLGISLCRALRIPARMVCGFLYQLEPMDLHAWFEAFVGGRWYTFDATQKKPRGNRIIIAYGRDAADVAQVTEYQPLEIQKQTVWVEQD